MKPNFFSSGGCHSMILRFCRKEGHCLVFFTPLGDERISKKKKKKYVRPTTSRVTNSISDWVSIYAYSKKKDDKNNTL